MTYAEYLAKNGGMATCGEHLGVFVGTDEAATPNGWVFVPMPTTPQIVREAIDHAKRGRSQWPAREV